MTPNTPLLPPLSLFLLLFLFLNLLFPLCLRAVISLSRPCYIRVMATFSIVPSRGRYLVPVDVLDELHDHLLTPNAKGVRPDYITLANQDSDTQICCAPDWSTIINVVQKKLPSPYARTEEEAKNRLSAWLEKEDLRRQSAAPIPASSSPCRCAIATVTPPIPKARQSSTSSVPFAFTQEDALEQLRKQGYRICLLSATPSRTNITPPPPYERDLPFASQPTRTVEHLTTPPRPRSARGLDGTDSYGKRKWESFAESYADSRSSRDPPSEDATEIADSEEEEEDEEEEPVRPAKQRKTHAWKRTTRAATKPSVPTTPPRMMKTKRSTMTTTLSKEAAEQGELTYILAQVQLDRDA